MHFYLLRHIADTEHKGEYDCAQGFVVRAKGPKAARQIASNDCFHADYSKKDWLNPKLTTCKRLHEHGAAKVIMVDFLNG